MQDLFWSISLRPEINTTKSIVRHKLNNLLTHPAYQRGYWLAYFVFNSVYYDLESASMDS